MLENPEKKHLKVIVIPEGDYLVAQCLDYDIAVQALGITELQDRFKTAIETHAYLAKESGETPFENLQQAPQEYWRLWYARKTIDTLTFIWPDLEWAKNENLPLEAELALG